MAGIAAAAFYLPRHVITAEAYRNGAGRFEAQGVTEKGVAGFDEDEVTMAVAAADRLLASEDLAAIDVLAFATSNPVAGGTIVAEALGLSAAKARDVWGSADTGETSLAGAIDAAGRERTTTLVIAADVPRSDPASPEEDPLGAAAVALLVTPDGAASWGRGTRPSQSVIRHRVGDVGAASVLLSFLTTIEPSQVAGDTDVARALKERAPVTYEQYLAMRRHVPPPGTEYSQGAYVSLSAYRSEAKARYRLVGEKCTACGRVHFPPRESCIACGSQTWEDAALPRTGRVYSYTIIGKGAAPSEFLEQQLALGDYATAVVEIEGGLRVAAMLTDTDPKDVSIGMPVRMVFRRIYTQEGATRYGFKFAPA